MAQREKRADRAARMQALRLAQGFTSQTAFAAFLGVPLSRWNNVEIGLPVSSGMAQLLVQKIAGLSLDWIYHGNEAGLAVAMRDRLRAVEPEVKKRA